MAAQKVICDTDVMIDYWDESQQRHQETVHVLENVIGLDHVIITSVTKLELMIGALNKVELNRIEKRLKRFTLAMPMDEATETAFELVRMYRLSHGIKLADSMIAAMALEASLPLFTYNVRDFRFIKGLTLFKHP